MALDLVSNKERFFGEPKIIPKSLLKMTQENPNGGESGIQSEIPKRTKLDMQEMQQRARLAAARIFKCLDEGVAEAPLRQEEATLTLGHTHFPDLVKRELMKKVRERLRAARPEGEKVAIPTEWVARINNLNLVAAEKASSKAEVGNRIIKRVADEIGNDPINDESVQALTRPGDLEQFPEIATGLKAKQILEWRTSALKGDTGVSIMNMSQSGTEVHP